MAGLALAAVACAALVSWRFGRRLRRTLSAAGAAAERIGNGQLDQPVAVGRPDEIGRLMRSLERARGSLVRVVSEVRQGVESVGTASDDGAHHRHRISLAVGQQSSGIGEPVGRWRAWISRPSKMLRLSSNRQLPHKA